MILALGKINMTCDLWALYELMLKSRLFEEAVSQLWHDGLISGEMHLGTGEEGIVAGVVAHLREGDYMALDHRGTPPMVMRGVDPVLILRELLGQAEGLCAGMGGHMHMFSKEHLAASSGIVGAAGPTAAGFGLAAQYLRPGAIAVAFFGEGAMNQGMLMESLNLAFVWKLPVLFVCKDDQWAITSVSDSLTGGELTDRAKGLGVPAIEADGRDVTQVWDAARQAIDQIRSGQGPIFLHARCIHLEGHFLGYQLLRVTRNLLQEMPSIAAPLTRSLIHFGGAPLRERLAGLRAVIAAILDTLRDPRRDASNDPITRTRIDLRSQPSRLQALEDAVEQEISLILSSVLQGAAV